MKDLSYQTFRNVDFSDKDLTSAKMNHSQFLQCKFDRAILSYADCSHSRFTGSTLIDTHCKNTNFAHSVLNCIFKPADAMGMTITLKCETFRGMIVSSFWWYCWLFFSLLMTVEKDKEGKDPRDYLIQALGTVKYLTLKRMFRERELG